MRLFRIYIGHKDPGWFQYVNIAQIMFTWNEWKLNGTRIKEKKKKIVSKVDCT